MKIDFSSDIFIPLYQPYLTDYSKDVEIYYGGRNSGKSWFVYDKHKIFLYKEDFEKFSLGLEDIIKYIKENAPQTGEKPFRETPAPSFSDVSFEEL